MRGVGLAAFSPAIGEITEGKSALKHSGSRRRKVDLDAADRFLARERAMAVDGDGVAIFLEAATFLPESPYVFAFEGS